MRLTDLNAHFLSSGGTGVTDVNGHPVPERTGVGVMFDCPCGCGANRYVPFANPIDDKGPDNERGWQRVGDTLETLTLSPSILVVGECGWHGFIRNGQIENA